MLLTVDLERLLQLWRAPPLTPAFEVPASRTPEPAEAGTLPAPAVPPPPLPDPAALLAALEGAVQRAWGAESKEFAIVRDLLEYGPQMKATSAPGRPPKIGDLVRAVAPANGPPPSPAARTALCGELAKHLDRLEDVLDALLVATETAR